MHSGTEIFMHPHEALIGSLDSVRKQNGGKKSGFVNEAVDLNTSQSTVL